ncbi:hypothetical protein JG688_00010423 [Phytophthora aleatoria]|uniref:Uncharacterized protein n=1 Tax=Phytophthora aleatoria TaxID=2496075 RepID=A0A8J5IM46_9STRA|nr:hypothetical protein JG688_00010423 [Phytophthora aleatoria]
MTGGELPLGLQADDFPQSLEDIEFCVTNLISLPDDLDMKWPQYASIYLEASQFLEVPQSLVRLAPYDLSLSSNPISTIPAELFESELVAYLSFGGTLISELPENVSKLSSSMYDIRVDNTNISFFWSWIDPVIESAGAVLSDVPTTIVASNTPYCSDLQRIVDGEQASFSAPQYEGQSKYLSEPSQENWITLKQAVECGEWPTILYPIESEDKNSAVNIK